MNQEGAVTLIQSEMNIISIMLSKENGAADLEADKKLENVS